MDSSEKLLWGQVNQGIVKSKRKSNMSPEGSLFMAICTIPHLSYVSIHHIRFPSQNRVRVSWKLRKPFQTTILWDSSAFTPVIFDCPQNLGNVSIDLRKKYFALSIICFTLAPFCRFLWSCFTFTEGWRRARDFTLDIYTLDIVFVYLFPTLTLSETIKKSPWGFISENTSAPPKEKELGN